MGSWFSSDANASDAACEAAKTTYLTAYPDVKSAGQDAWKHYTETGHKEGRNWEGKMCGPAQGGPYKWTATRPSTMVYGGKDSDDTSLYPCAAYIASSGKWVPGKLRDKWCYATDTANKKEVGEGGVNVRYLENVGTYAWTKDTSAPNLVKANDLGVCRAARPGDPGRSVLGHVWDGKCTFHGGDSVSDFFVLQGPSGDNAITDKPANYVWGGSRPEDSQLVKDSAGRMAVCGGSVNGKEKPGKLWDNKCYVADGDKEHAADVSKYLDRKGATLEWSADAPSNGTAVMLGDLGVCQMKVGDEPVIGHRYGNTCYGGHGGKAHTTTSNYTTLYLKR
jgi:hypothetical protein